MRVVTVLYISKNMKIKSFLLSLLLISVLFPSCSNEIRTQLISDLPSYTEDSVIIKPNAVIFIFKINPKSTWTWYQKDTPQNLMEYSWSAVFKFENTQYECGYHLFKHPSAKQNTGSFKQLLKAGRFDLWTMNFTSKKHITGNRYLLMGSSNRVEYARIEPVVVSNSMGIILKEKDIVEKFQNFKPDSITFQHKTPGKTYSSKNIRVDYQLD